MPITGPLITASTITGTTIITAITPTDITTGLILCQAPAAHTMAVATTTIAIYMCIMHLITRIIVSLGYWSPGTVIITDGMHEGCVFCCFIIRNFFPVFL